MSERRKLLVNGIKKAGLKEDAAKTDRLLSYMDLVLEKNRVMNLTAITDEAEFIEKNLIDCLLGAPYFSEAETILDMGSGAGLPGIVLSIYLDEKNFVLVDSLKKRIGFLDEVIEELGLCNVRAVHKRAEDLAKEEDYRDGFDAVTARAVSRMNVLMEYTLPFVKPEGRLVMYKGRKAAEELNESAHAMDALKGELSGVYSYSLPFSGDERNMVLIKKTDFTPKKYPRNPGRIKKRPL